MAVTGLQKWKISLYERIASHITRKRLRTNRAASDRIRLSQRDFRVAVDAIETPPAPSEALRKAVRAKYGG